MEYVGEDNERHRPVIIHRTVLGSIERFLGILIEHYGGALPPWLAAVQVEVVPVADRHVEYANVVRRELECAGLRVEVDARTESVSKKIRDGEVAKTPYLLVVGDREVKEDSVTIRLHGSRDTRSVSLSEAVRDIGAGCEPPTAQPCA